MTTARNIYAAVKEYFTENGIPISNLISDAFASDHAIMGRHYAVLKVLKNDDSNMMAVHCIIHRENLAAAATNCELNQL